MSDSRLKYRQILKATSLFGGVQFFQIIIALARSKIIAILLGPTGMGITSLLNASIELISGFTNFGLGVSAIKNVSVANATENKTKIAIIVSVLNRLIWITGILGSVVTIILAKWISQLTFGNTDYQIAFIWISCTLLFKQLTTGQLVVLQGLRKLKFLAQANVWGSFLGLLITAPLYYYFKLDGIVPGIIGTAVISFLLSWYYSRKVKIEKVKVTRARTIAEGKGMLTMGVAISSSALIGLAVAYIVRIFIRNEGDINQVGLFNAGFAIINSYVGLIFTAMSTDYYPRLSEVAKSNTQSRNTINQQAEIAILILAPIIIVFLVFVRWIIIILYSTEFEPIDGMIHWAALGMLFKAVSWSVAFIFLAKGASKLFFVNELASNIYMLGLNLLGYSIWGLTGLGIAFMIGYIFYLIQVFIISKIKYQFKFNKSFIKLFVIQFLLSLSCFITIKVFNKPITYIIGSLFIVVSSVYSFKELEKRIAIKELVGSFISKKIKK